MQMARRRQLYEGKAKILSKVPSQGRSFDSKEHATGFNAQKKGDHPDRQGRAEQRDQRSI